MTTSLERWRTRVTRWAVLGGTLGAALGLAGCVSVRPDPYATAPVREALARATPTDCARIFAQLDAAVDRVGVRDAQAVRVPGFPYLRADRLAVALAPRVPRDAWLAYTGALDVHARRAELAQLSSHTAAGEPLPDEATLNRCRADLLQAAGAADPRTAAHVPDDYSSALRALGLYPVTKLAFAAGIRTWHAQTRDVFAAPLDALPARGARIHYAPAATHPTTPPAGWVDPALAAAIGLPALSVRDAWDLLQQHAPQFAVETTTNDDRIGALVWRDGADGPRVRADPQQPVVYARLSTALFDGEPHLQLVYTVWFPARPAAGWIDPLAGPLDGLVWRVTLDRAGRAPLVYDTIHPCGCYHLFFPTARVRARPAPPAQGRFDEGLFVPQSAPALEPGQRVLLHVEARTHYLQRLSAVPAHAAGVEITPLQWQSDDALRALPLPAGGMRSVFDEDGLIDGSQRSERFFFWPMGIQSAGQMRQWGRHATAFVGRRHFDDPALLAKYFDVAHP